MRGAVAFGPRGKEAVKILADLSALQKILSDVSAVTSGPVKIEISAPVKITVTAADGTVILDTTQQVDMPESSGG